MNSSSEFPIDAIYTWVNGHDPNWLQKKAHVLKNIQDSEESPDISATSESRFIDNEELKYSLRSLELYAPWIRKIHLVTDRQVPPWINTSRVHIVDHEDIFPNNAALPSFNSHAIELCLHRIQGLSEHFLYFNDDFILGRCIPRHNFFTHSGLPVLWLIKKGHKHRHALLNDDYASMSPHKAGEVRARRLVFERFKRYYPYLVRHYPRPMRRSTFHEIWDQFPDHVERTLAHSFRTTDDIAIHILYPFYALATGQGIPCVINGVRQFIDILAGKPRHIGASLGDDNFQRKMRLITLTKPLTFCLNDCPWASSEDRLRLGAFLQKMFPRKSSFER